MVNGKEVYYIWNRIWWMAWDEEKEECDFCKLNEIKQFRDAIENFLIQHGDDEIISIGYRTFIDALEFDMGFEFRTSFTKFEEVREYANEITERLGKTIYIILSPKEKKMDCEWVREYDVYLLNKETREWEYHYCASSHTECDALEQIDNIVEDDAW